MINGLLKKINNKSADIDRSIKKLNYNPKIDIESGIPLFIDWYNSYTSN